MSARHREEPVAERSEATVALVGIERLAEEYVARLRRGERPRVAEYAQSHPELADEIAELFPTLAMLEDCAPGAPLEPTPRPDLGRDVPRQLGDYQILREIGRGGMGVVYEAEHRTLRRRVALKLLPLDAAAEPQSLQRFLSEARAAGRLHHSNIVPVFEVGVHRGWHFYAMQYIHGQNLDAVIGELRRLQNEQPSAGGDVPLRSAEGSGADGTLSRTVAQELLSGVFSPPADGLPPSPTGPPDDSAPLSDASDLSQVGSSSEGYFQRVARVGLQVAEAIDYAHRHGVLHRDIKPSNLILDTTGTVWVTDFGLAKHEASDLTHSGDIVGTLRYMAPERLQGRADPRSDIYGLGLTLYELVTLCNAFDGADRIRLLRQIEQHVPPAPRALVPQIPRDLETILLKAMEKSPSDRYPTAADMAEDLRLFLADRPVRARRSSAAERAWRWCRRNPAPSILASCVAVLLLVLVAGSLIVAVVTARQAQRLAMETARAVQAEQQAMQAKEEAVRRLYEASLGQARAGRWSARTGQHYSALRSVAQAAQILPALGLSEQETSLQKLVLRNEAIAAMPLVDLEEVRRWPVEQGWTSAVAFSPDYSLLAQSDGRGDVQVRRVEDDSEVVHLEGPGQRAWILTFSPDGRFLAGKFHRGTPRPTPPAVRVWDLQTERLVLAEDQGLNRARMAFRADSQQFALSRADGEVRLYNLPDGSLATRRRLDAEPYDVCYDPSGTQLAISLPGMNPVRTWDLPTDQLQTLRHTSGVNTLSWSPDGQVLAMGTFSGSIFLYHVRHPNRPARELQGHQANVTQMMFNHRGDLLVSRAWDGTMRLWRVATGLQALRVDASPLRATGFRQDDRQLAFAIGDAAFGIWDLAGDLALRLLPGRPEAPSRHNVVFHPQQPELLASCTRNGVEVWNADTGTLLQVLGRSPVVSAVFSPDGRRLLTSGDGGVQGWMLAEPGTAGPPIVSATPDLLLEGASERIQIDARGRLLAVDRGFSDLALLSLERNEEPRLLHAQPHLDHVAISPDGQWLVTSTWQGSGLLVWNVPTGRLFRNLAPEMGSATPAFSPNGRWLAASDGVDCWLWEVDSWKLMHRIPRDSPDDWPGPVAFSPDSQLLAVAQTRYVAQILDPHSGRRLAILEPPASTSLSGYSFSCDSRYLAAAEAENIQLWDLVALRQRLAQMQIDWASADGDASP